jgi:hypothetical protein
MAPVLTMGLKGRLDSGFKVIALKGSALGWTPT